MQNNEPDLEDARYQVSSKREIIALLSTLMKENLELSIRLHDTEEAIATSILRMEDDVMFVKAAPDQPEGASGLVVAAFQIAIASGAVLGGLLVDNLGPTGVIGYCGLATLLGAALVLGFGRKAAA